MAIGKDDIKLLIEEKIETPNKDFKEEIIWNRQNRDDCLSIIKDVIGMANTKDGGKIVIGVKDDDFSFVGVSDESFKSFDPTPFHDLLSNYADPIFNCSLIKTEIEGKKVVVIDVPEFSEVPIICKDSANSKTNKEILKKGAVYIRTDKCSTESISTADEMRRILGIGITKKSQEIFQIIQNIVSGKPTKSENKKIRSNYKNEIEDAKNFISNNTPNPKNAGRWELVVYPSSYNPKLIENSAKAGEVIESSKVRLRGWDFPHIDSHGRFTNFNDGKQSVTTIDLVPHQEAWRIYKSGLFVWNELLGEDLMEYREENDRRVFFYVSRLYSITEMILFAKRLYGETLNSENIHFSLKIEKTKNRQLSDSGTGMIFHNYICTEDFISIEKDISRTELISSFKDVAKTIIKDVFMMFNWNDPLDSVLDEWQNKLIEKGG